MLGLITFQDKRPIGIIFSTLLYISILITVTFWVAVINDSKILYKMLKPKTMKTECNCKNPIPDCSDISMCGNCGYNLTAESRCCGNCIYYNKISKHKGECTSHSVALEDPKTGELKLVRLTVKKEYCCNNHNF